MTLRAFLLTTTLAFVSCVNTMAQSAEAPKQPGCPTISVLGPSGVTAPDDMAWFEVSITPDASPNLTYFWKLDRGQVNEGQATKRIAVRYTRELRGTTVTATVEVNGLPSGCSNTASESAPLTYCPDFVLLSEFSVPITSVDTKSLKIAATELTQDPNSQLYIIEYFPDTASKAAVKRKLDLVVNHMVRSLKFDRSRITMVVGESGDGRPRTKIYQIPPGAANPNP